MNKRGDEKQGGVLGEDPVKCQSSGEMLENALGIWAELSQVL